MRRAIRPLAGAALAAGLFGTALSAAGCSGSSPQPPPAPNTSATAAVFDYQGGRALTCLDHQQQEPTDAYRAGPTAISELELPMLAYYTRNGGKPFCDGKPPSAVDRAWLETYVQDGADPTKVQRYLN